MKFFIAILALGAFVAAKIEWMPKTNDEIKANRFECFAENSIPDKYREKIQMTDYSDEEATRKYILCAMSKAGLFNEHEGLHVDRLDKQFGLKLDEDDSTRGVVEKCADKNEEKSSTDEWAYRILACILNSKSGETIREFIKSATKAA